MATFEYNDKIKFMLPAGFIFSRDEDDEGNEVVSILTGEYENDEGETNYKFNCRVNYTEYDPSEADEEFTSDNLLDLLAERMENSRRMKLPGAPKTILLNKGHASLDIWSYYEGVRIHRACSSRRLGCDAADYHRYI